MVRRARASRLARRIAGNSARSSGNGLGRRGNQDGLDHTVLNEQLAGTGSHDHGEARALAFHQSGDDALDAGDTLQEVISIGVSQGGKVEAQRLHHATLVSHVV